MNIWERVVLNMQKGAKNVAATAATFSERVRVEVAIVRLRLRIDEVTSRIAELHRTVGRKLVDLQKKMPCPRRLINCSKMRISLQPLSNLLTENRRSRN